MALNRDVRYPGRFDAPTTARPQGAFKNRSAPGAKDGSYLERDWANDWDGFFGSLLRSAGMTPNGTPDTALSSQYFDALKSLGLRQATESVSGVSKFSTLIQALAGTDNNTSMTPAKVMAALTNFFPKRSFLASDYIRIPDVPGGLILQIGSAAVQNSGQGASSETVVSFAVSFPTVALGCVTGLEMVNGGVAGSDTPYYRELKLSGVNLGIDAYASASAIRTVSYLVWGN